jgi:glycosyltransferase involved in cell wall biosynthesis
MSRVDVIVPCYNYARFLRECVGSVLGQKKVDVRVLIIDDASKDDTAHVAAELARVDGRVEFRPHASNWGHIATYNEGLEWSTGEYTLLLSADDLLTQGSLLRSTRLMDAHPEVGFTHGRAIKTTDPNLITYTEQPNYTSQIIAGGTFFHSICATGENVIETPTVLVRTNLQKVVGGYKKELPHAGDMEMWLRLSLHAAVGYVSAQQACYRLHDQNMSLYYYDHMVRDLLQRKAVFESLFQEYAHRIRRWEWFRRLADRSLAEQAFWQANKAFDRGELGNCEQCLDFAQKVCPSLRYWPAWWRLRLKQMIGPMALSALRLLARQLRGFRVPAPL